ncbi:NAD(P)-dependent oxidoreductase [Kribbella sp. CA-253562]|uniref:NAD(P)-dependent oxidoreductase n=1 Tax=Kribbella sp. CA-253562 TaxID=3239942 RepID=UPI003D8F1A71
MSRILVFGAGGRAGRAAVEEARRRGHEVTAAVRTPGKYAGPPVAVVAADITDLEAVRRLAVEHDAVIAAVYDGGADPVDFFPRVGKALADGIGGTRLVWVGLASILADDNGTLLMDTPGYPQEYRSFYAAHQAAVDLLAGSQADWVSITPCGDFDHEHPERTGAYRIAPADAASRISYADLAIALLDEIDTPRHHGELLGVRRA